MKFAPATSVTQVTTPALDKVRQQVTGLRSAVSRRFQNAAAAFVERLAFEKDATPTPVAAEPKTLLLCGYLFPLGAAQALPLYEGNFTVDVSDAGAVAFRFPQPGVTGGTWLRLERDFVELVDADGNAPERFHTNDMLALGTRRFLLKLVDPACRIPMSVVVDANGGLR